MLSGQLNYPKVSIIVPVYNSKLFLNRCVRSITCQTYSNIEIILIDDGSTDGSAGMCDRLKETDKRFVVIHQKNKGVSAARNRGIRCATGSFITFVDADDWLENNGIQTMTELIMDSEVDCARTHYCIETVNRSYIPKQGLKTGIVGGRKIIELLNDLLLVRDNCYCVLLIIRREMLVKNNIVFPTNIPMMEDVLFYIDVISHAKGIVISDTPTYHYLQNQASRSKGSDKLFENALSTIKVSGLIKRKIIKLHLESAVNIRNLQAIHLSLIASRLVTVADNDSSYLTVKLIKQYTDFLRDNDSFNKMSHEANLSILPNYLKLTVQFLVNGSSHRLLWLIKIRLLAHKMKQSLRGVNE